MIFSIKSFLLDLLFPLFCVGCEKEGSHICRECFTKIAQQNQGKHSILSPPHAINEIISACEFHHNSPLAELIHRFKYDGAVPIGSLLAGLFQKLPEGILVPVPLHPNRYRFRGFNQSSVLAQLLSERFHLPLNEILIRHRSTKPQVELDGKERYTNVHHAFSLKENICINPQTTYLLIDDVYTTGATVNECAKVLKAEGAQKVIGVVVAKAVEIRV